MASHGISRTEYAASRSEAVQEKERNKLTEYLALVEQTQQKRSAGDYSLSALELTSKVLKLNPEFYTMWNYRRQILLRTRLLPFTAPEPPKDAPAAPEGQEDPAAVAGSLRAAYESRLALLLKEELEFLIPLLMSFPKCYWIWNHRLWALQQCSMLLSPEKGTKFWQGELQLVGMMLTRDMRNFHGWMYRRIVVSHIENPVGGEYSSLAKDELEYTRRMVRGVGGMTNYSAWHQRSVLIPRLLEENGKDDQERMDCLEDELQLLMSAIETDPDDQSLWFYYRWLVSARDKSSIAPKMPHLVRIAMVTDQVEWLKELLEAHPDCKYILKALVAYAQLLQALRKEPLNEGESEDDVEEVDETAENQQILGWLETLERMDPMRKGRYRDQGKVIRANSEINNTIFLRG